MHSLTVFAGNSNLELARDICRHIGIRLGEAEVKTFSDGEIQVEIRENVRGKDVFVLQSTCSPVNDYLLELLLMVDAFRRASAQRTTAVIPYYGYARQDKKVAPRVPISAKLVADLITVAGADRVITMDLHAGQIQGFFNTPVDNLYAAPVLLEYIKDNFKNDTVIVSPDAGGVERARAFAKRLNSLLAIIDKRREAPNQAEAMHVVGGALEVHACCAHAVLSGPCLQRITESDIKTVVVTNTIPLSEKARACDKIRVLSVSKLLAEAIHRCHTGSSVSSLFV
jgi:ribose-phosphate pyrophosphokinase